MSSQLIKKKASQSQIELLFEYCCVFEYSQAKKKEIKVKKCEKKNVKIF